MTEDHEAWLVWSVEHGRWWGPGRNGYVRRLSEAGRYSHDDAVAIATNAIPGDALRHGALQELPIRLVDVRLMQAMYRSRFPDTPLEGWE